MNGNNIIRVCGTVKSELFYSHKKCDEEFWCFNIEVSRLSTDSDILPVTFSERIIAREKLTAGTKIFILGQIRSYNTYSREEGKSKLVLTIFSRKITVLNNVADTSQNEVFLNGFLCKSVAYRTTPYGREISDMTIAVNRSFNKSDYIPCIAWGGNAKFSTKLKIGERIKIIGRFQSRKYIKGKDEKIAYEVSINKLYCLTSEL